MLTLPPPITDPTYIPYLKAICKETKTDIIIPYITAELELIAQHKQEFEDIGVKVSVASEEAVRQLNDKNYIAHRYGTFAPDQIYTADSKVACMTMKNFERRGKQVCCKITGKCGGTGFCIIDDKKAYDISLYNRCGANRYISKDDLYRILEQGHSIIMQEYVPGLDYSVCVLADHGKPVKMVGYVGYDMEFGAVVNGQILTNERAFDIVANIVREEKFDGNACFDFILEGQSKERDLLSLKISPVRLLECNPRINASIGFCKYAGANLVYMRCKQLLGEDLAGIEDPIREGLKMQKYYESEYYV